MSSKPPSRVSSGDIRGVSGVFDVPVHGERSQSCSKPPSPGAMDARGLAQMRGNLVSRLERALLDLILTAHEVNRWDLVQDAIDKLCDAAVVYARVLDEELQANGGHIP